MLQSVHSVEWLAIPTLTQDSKFPILFWNFKVQAFLQVLVSEHLKNLILYVGKNKCAAFYQLILFLVCLAVILFPTMVPLQAQDFNEY